MLVPSCERDICSAKESWTILIELYSIHTYLTANCNHSLRHSLVFATFDNITCSCFPVVIRKQFTFLPYVITYIMLIRYDLLNRKKTSLKLFVSKNFNENLCDVVWIHYFFRKLLFPIILKQNHF